jgi:hypothetical protein
MPSWLTALLALIIVSSFGAYMVYVKEGFDTSRTICNNTYNTCVRACSPTDSGACLRACGDSNTKCLANAAAAATVINTGPLNRPYTNTNMAWEASLGYGLLGNSNASSNGYMEWRNPAGSSTSISVYNTDTTRMYRPSGWDSAMLGSNVWGRSSLPSPSSTQSTSSSSSTQSPSSTSTQSPSSTQSTSSSSSTQSPSSTSTQSPSSTPSTSWDMNRNRYTTGWPQQSFNLEVDDSYDPNSPVEGSYVVNVKRWKPHDTPIEEARGVRVDAPTDSGSEADSLRDSIPSLQQMVRGNVFVRDDIVSDTLRELIKEDVKDTMDGIFRNQYEIKYT